MSYIPSSYLVNNETVKTSGPSATLTPFVVRLKQNRPDRHTFSLDLHPTTPSMCFLLKPTFHLPQQTSGAVCSEGT
jgi:hypothetical protein